MDGRILYRLAILLGTTPAALRLRMTAAEVRQWAAYLALKRK